MIPRSLEKIINSKLFQKKAIIIIGPRQAGKTTLLHQLFPEQNQVIWFNGDETDVQNIFREISAERLRAIIGQKRIIIIDEAQRIRDIGLRLKLITDYIPNVQVIATGSSSLELANQINEPLTGRKWEYKMFPLSFSEMIEHHGLLSEKRLLPHRLVYGYYPDIINHPGSEKERLFQLSDSYLYKDILMLEQIKKPEKLQRLLQALALQVGSQVSFNELGSLCSLDSKTVEKYINLLEKTFVIFKVGSFSRNIRNELKNSKKIYFFDNGIRNALISNFNQIENRTDVGPLWENFLMSERYKYLHYQQIGVNGWFWRTIDQKEINYIEESNGQLSAYEFKWNPDAKIKSPKKFTSAYPEAHFTVIHRENFETFCSN